MGCGSSRLGGVAAARAEKGGVMPISAGMRPILRRRVEEMKKWSHTSVLKNSQTLSKKELLRRGSSDYGEETDVSEVSLKSSAKVAPTPNYQVEEKEEDISDKISSSSDDDDGIKNGDDNVINLDDDATIVKKESDDDDEGRVSNFDERMISPGSPSFKVYCVDVVADEDKGEENARKSMETKSVIKESKEEEIIVKKEREGKRFGMGLPRKYLANVTGPCYSAGGVCMGNNHSRLMQEKSNQ